MIFRFILIAVCAAGFVQANLEMNAEEMAVAQERLREEYNEMRNYLRYLIDPEESRRYTSPGCLKEGSKCEIFTGANCCGTELRCASEGSGLFPTTNQGTCKKYRLGAQLVEWFG